MWDGEVRVFTIEQCKPDTFMKPFGDLTDLKFFSVDLAVQLDMQPLNTKAKLLNPSRQKEREVFIIILFNSKHTRVNELKSSNTFFHFADLENSQYFGYRWDANHSRQPEYRNFDSLGAHEGIAGNIYWGAYSEFVKPVMWLDAGKVMRLLEGKDVEQLIMDDMNKQLSQDELYQNAATPEQKLAVIQANYRIAYVQYPESEIDKILEFLPIEKIGVAVMVGYDKDLDGLYVPVKDARWQNGKTPEGADPAAVAAFDKDDSFFFSNHVVLEDVLARDVTLDGFDECEVTLKDEHRRILNEKVIPRLLENPDAKVKLIGYTDATPMSEDCIKSYGNGNQVGLANARAQSVQNYLVYCGGIAKDRLPIEARGILLPRHEHEPKDRCVIIRFIR
jgi:outer membrane protein OmpA-like peptidoglycan-associated protein